MSEETPPLDVKPLQMTDELMQELFTLVAEDPEWRPWKGEVDNFFESRIWKTIEHEGRMLLAGLYRKAASTPMTPGMHAEITSAIRMMEWWLNLRDSIFAARERATGLDAQQAGGESWQERP